MRLYGWTLPDVDALDTAARERLRRGLATRELFLEAEEYRRKWARTQATTVDNMRATGLRP